MVSKGIHSPFTLIPFSDNFHSVSHQQQCDTQTKHSKILPVPTAVAKDCTTLLTPNKPSTFPPLLYTYQPSPSTQDIQVQTEALSMLNVFTVDSEQQPSSMVCYSNFTPLPTTPAASPPSFQVPILLRILSFAHLTPFHFMAMSYIWSAWPSLPCLQKWR